MTREHIVRVRLDDAELAALDAAAAGAGLSRSRRLRQLILTGPGGDASTAPTREEALGLLEGAARGGSVTAQVALARECVCNRCRSCRARLPGRSRSRSCRASCG